MKTSTQSKAQRKFLKDVSVHVMEAKLDQGLYRHLRFQQPGSWVYGFDLVTWPGHLCFRGDVGSYLFSRVEDMLDFFRIRESEDPPFGYWAEKCLAQDSNSAIREWSADRFELNVREYLRSSEASKEVRAAVRDDVLPMAGWGEHEAMASVWSFRHAGFAFDDFSAEGCKDYTNQYLWSCYAIAWGVRVYDSAAVKTGGVS
jgi:hypothetical protein